MRQNNKLNENNIGKLLLNLSLPATVGMMVTAFYNIIDTIFIGRGVGTLAIGGLTIAFPIQMLIMAFAMMIGIGTASLVSRSLGAGNQEKAEQAAGNSFLAIIVLSSIIVALGIIFLEPLLIIFGATPSLLPFAKDYMSIIFYGSVFFSFVMSSNNLVRAEGNARDSMLIMIIGTGINIILDPIFIFSLDMGIKGAALATIISQFVSFIYLLVYLFGGKSSLKIRLRHFKPIKGILTEIFTVGSAAFARQVSGSLVAIILNNSLKVYGGDMALSIIGIINRVTMFLFLPLFGVIQGMQPIAGYNYGAKRIDKVKEVVKISLIVTTVLATICVLFGELFSPQIIQIFSTDTELVSRGSGVLRIVISMIPIVGIQIVGASLFQALGKATPSLILSLLRQVFLFTPLVIILPRIYNLELLGVWLAFPIADILATIITLLFFKNEMKKLNLEFAEE